MRQPGQRITVAKADSSSASAIARLMKQLVFETSGGSPVATGYVRKYLRTSGCHVLLARQSGEVLGMISFSLRPGLYHAARSCVIEDLIVDRGWRNKGIGSRLLAEVIRTARRRKCAEISVTTETTNKAAARFYRRHGLVDESIFLEKHL